MNDHLDNLINKHRNSGILIDTNILLMLIVGTYDRQHIARFSRTDKYLPEDFDQVKALISNFKQLVSTPAVLAEVSNLAGQLCGNVKDRCLGVFTQHIEIIDERQLASVKVAHLAEFTRFGLTDSSIISIARQGILVLTDDLDLSIQLETLALPVINYTHLREVLLLN